mmetsp:Transcript_21691/g.53802  ORF Transcript_21691/g.53802 Transcript_21691/m.53802 type:complete len:202 (-) Transcript_21691:24-629(-)|eukprot:CAMPEP_0116098934 /NCGR_PEP_ID=MMETSP0327-20121206/11498_1 /TAXON_ID=44447 /ORGANISM="Pseudo-nitzschia delicatissima, Strain B596" /LENGTH=201 /DNA_ID=CAMNT_0003590775 /DNA_START=32 /DNA_END=637 /DNA_ORIENTATION=+
MTVTKQLVLATVAIHLPASAVAMYTPNGYLCNLCHSLQNDHPFPPQSAQEVVVRFSKSENEQFGLPWDRGITCLEVWDTVLDFANPNVYDQASCRAMAAAYAPQCCNDIVEEPQESLEENEEGNQSNEEEGTGVDAELGVEESSVVSKVSNSIDEEIESTQSSTQQISSSNLDSGRSDDKDMNDDNNVRRATVISHLRGRK